MSSGSTVISNDEYRRLTYQAKRAVNAEKELEKIRRNSEKRERDLMSQYEAEFKAVSDRIAWLSKKNDQRTDKLAQDYNKQLEKQSREFAKKIEEERQSAKAALKEEIEKNEKKFDAIGRRIDRTNDYVRNVDVRLENIATEYATYFEQIAKKETSKKQRAHLAASELDMMLDAAKELRTYKFAPSEYGRLVSIRAKVEQNLENADYEAAISSLQNCMVDATKLVAKLVIMNDEFNELLYNVKKKANCISTDIKSYGKEVQNTLDYIDKDNKHKSIDFDIYEWSDGAFEKVVSAFNNTEMKIENANNDNATNIKELMRINAVLDKISASVIECEEVAKSRRIGAVSVQDTVKRVAEVLYYKDWQIDGNSAGFEDDDKKKPYRLTAVNEDGTKISFVIAQGPDADKTNLVMDVKTAGEEQNEEEKSITEESVRVGLISNGVEVDKVIRNDDCHMNMSTDDFIKNATKKQNDIIKQRNIDFNEKINSDIT